MHSSRWTRLTKRSFRNAKRHWIIRPNAERSVSSLNPNLRQSHEQEPLLSEPRRLQRLATAELVDIRAEVVVRMGLVLKAPLWAVLVLEVVLEVVLV